MNLIRLTTACALTLGLSSCFQTQLAGPTGGTTLAISELRSGDSAASSGVSLGPENWIALLEAETWDGYPPVVQLALLGVTIIKVDTLDPGTLYVVTANDGMDYDPTAATTQIDPSPVQVQGSWHAIAFGERISKGNVKVSALTEAIYQQIQPNLALYDDLEISMQLDAAAQLLLADVSGDGIVNYDDALLWNRSANANKYLGDLAALDQLAAAVTAGQPNDMLASQAKLVYGSSRVSLSISYGESTGVIEMETLNWEAPIGAANFLQYVRDEFYTDVFFHRVMANFMIQGGIWGVRDELVLQLSAEQRPAILNEARSGVSNLRATVAYARTSNPNSATSQFFISQADNLFLDYGSNSNPDGYTVFARVTSGMDVVDDIVTLPVRSVSGISEAVPSPDVVLDSAVISN